MRQHVQAQIEHTRTDAQRRSEEAQKKVDEVAVELSNLREQLNTYRLASEANVGAAQKQVTDEVEKQLTLQSSRIDPVSESVQKVQKVAEDNSEMLQNLLIGIKNMGE